MQLDVITLSIYRLNRSKEDLEAAISNHESGCNPETNLSIMKSQREALLLQIKEGFCYAEHQANFRFTKL